MKRLSVTASLSLLCTFAALNPVYGNDDTSIKATTVQHPDGSRTETLTNLAEKTAEERVVNSAGKQLRKTVYTLDDQGLPNGGVVYSADNRPTSRFQLIRDTMGNISEQRDYTVSGEIYQRRIFRTNTQGKVVGVDTYDAKGQLVHTTGSGSKKRQQQQQRRR